MLWYFLKCRKNNASKNPNVAMTKNRKIMFLAKSSVRGVKNQDLQRERT